MDSLSQRCLNDLVDVVFIYDGGYFRIFNQISTCVLVPLYIHNPHISLHITQITYSNTLFQNVEGMPPITHAEVAGR